MNHFKHKKPAVRLFTGLAGSALAHVNEDAPAPLSAPTQAEPASLEVRTPQQIVDETMQRVSKAHSEKEIFVALETGLAETRKRGRPVKYKTEEERKAADAARKRGDRKQEGDERLHESLSNRTGVDTKGSLPGEVTGGIGYKELEQKVATADAATLCNPNAEPEEGIGVPDRKGTAVPISPDKKKPDYSETDNTFMRRAGAELSRWAKAGGPKKEKSCIAWHQAKADQHQDSKIKVYCSCGKLLVNPGKTVKGIKRTEQGELNSPVTSLAA